MINTVFFPINGPKCRNHSKYELFTALFHPIGTYIIYIMCLMQYTPQNPKKIWIKKNSKKKRKIP